MASRGLLDIEVRYLDEHGDWMSGPLADVDAGAVVLGRPVRSFPMYKNQANYPGWLWSTTMRRLVGYESLLEVLHERNKHLRTENQDLRRRLEIAHGQLRVQGPTAPRHGRLGEV